jgi:hypothetical protein
MGSPLAMKALARRLVRERGLGEIDACAEVERLRAITRRRCITGSCVLLATGVSMNQAPNRSTMRSAAAVVTFLALFLLASQYTSRWLPRTGSALRSLFRRPRPNK